MNKEVQELITELNKSQKWQDVYEKYILPEIAEVNNLAGELPIPDNLKDLSPEQIMICKAVLINYLATLFAPLTRYSTPEEIKQKPTRYN